MTISATPIWVANNEERKFEVLKQSGILNPCVSVIVPVYNMGVNGYLAQLVDSLKGQGLTEAEFILIDDCPTDNSLSLMRELTASDARFTVIASGKNGRQGAARNIGLSCARGGYVGFVDGDDVVDPGYFSALYDVACRENADIALAPFVTVDERLDNASALRWPVDRAHLGEMTTDNRAYHIGHPAHVVCSLYKASLFSETGVRFPEGVYFEDNPTCLRLLCAAQSVAMLDDMESVPRYYYRQHGDSTDHRVDNLDVQIRDRLVTSNYMIDDAKACGYYECNHDALDLYYIKVCLLNSFSKLAAGGIAARNAASPREIRNCVQRHVRPLRENRQYAKMPLLRRLRVHVACSFPNAYMSALRLAVRLRRCGFPNVAD